MKSSADKPDGNIGHKSRLNDDETYLTRRRFGRRLA